MLIFRKRDSPLDTNNTFPNRLSITKSTIVIRFEQTD